jgi:hypothetical protein
MARQTPFYLGPFVLDSEGRLTLRTPDAPPGFVVRWRGRTVHAQVKFAEGGAGTLALETVLGRIPSSATAMGERSRSFDRLRRLRHRPFGAWKLRLLADHRAVLEAEAAIALPITAVNLVGEVTRALLDMTPYFDLMDEVGLRSPGVLPVANHIPPG